MLLKQYTRMQQQEKQNKKSEFDKHRLQLLLRGQRPEPRFLANKKVELDPAAPTTGCLHLRAK